jgi:hypothetical protein
MERCDPAPAARGLHCDGLRRGRLGGVGVRLIGARPAGARNANNGHATPADGVAGRTFEKLIITYSSIEILKTSQAYLG